MARWDGIRVSRRFGRGRGKLILFGEHAAVYGAAAIGVSLGVSTTLLLETGPGKAAKADHFPGAEESDAAVLRALLSEARKHDGPNGMAPAPGRWFGESDVPRSGGFGSSAALCVALARVMVDHGTPVVQDRYDLAVHERAHRLEGHFHGTPSGIDTGMAADNGLAAWYPDPPKIPKRVPVKTVLPPLVYGALPRTGNTGRLVGDLRRRRESGEKNVTEALDGLGEISESFIGLSQGSPKTAGNEVAKMVRGAQTLLRELGLSTPELDALFGLAENVGALAGKLSGAGGGGAFYLVADGPAGRDRLLRDLPPRLSDKGIALTVPLAALDVDGSQ